MTDAVTTITTASFMQPRAVMLNQVCRARGGRGRRAQPQRRRRTMKETKTMKRKPREPGDILRYLRNVHKSPRLKPDEILCHNHVAHLAWTHSGINGFRYFVCDGSPGHGWELCPCGWMPHFGKHYAGPGHVKYHHKRIAAGRPLTMWWPPEEAPPPGFRRVGRDSIAEQRGDVGARRR
jgi:hypothetical protein